MRNRPQPRTPLVRFLPLILACLAAAPPTSLAAETGFPAGPPTIRAEPVVQIGHYDGVNSVAFAPDGRRALTGSDDHTAIVWDAATGKRLMTLDVGWRVSSASFAPDGRTILTSRTSWDGASVTVWDAESAKRLRTFPYGGGSPLCATFSPDGRRILAGFDDGSAVLWDAETGRRLGTLTGHPRAVTCAAFSPDSRHVLTGSRDGTAVLWDANTGDKLAQFYPFNEGDDWLAVTPEGYYSGSAKYLRHRKPGTNELYPNTVTEQFRRPDLMKRLLAI